MISGKSIRKLVSIKSSLTCKQYILSKQISGSKVFESSAAAIADVTDNCTILFGGFGLCGIPENLIGALRDKSVRNLTCVSNDAGVGGFGLGMLLENNQVKRLYASYVGEHKTFGNLYNSGQIEVVLVPQGTLAEKLRAGGAGIPGFYTQAGLGTVVQYGGFPIKYKNDGSHEVEIYSKPKETKIFKGKEYLLINSIVGDYAFIKAYKGDRNGNLIFRSTARNFNPDCAKAASICIAEVEELVEVGELKPDEIHLPGVYVNRIVKGEKYEKRIEKVTTRKRDEHHDANIKKSAGDKIRERIARRAAKEFQDGMYINLGIGVPTLSSNFIPKGIYVELHSENGLMGTGPYPYEGEEDSDLINAGKETVSYVPGSSTFSSSESFAMIRGKHIDLTILGALEVSAYGDLASWIIPGKTVKGMGGAMDLLASVPKVIVTTTHTDKNGKSKILEECSLPLTGKGVVDMIITELAVFEVSSKKGLTLIEYAEGVSIDTIRLKTGATFKISDNLCVMKQ